MDEIFFRYSVRYYVQEKQERDARVYVRSVSISVAVPETPCSVLGIRW